MNWQQEYFETIKSFDNNTKIKAYFSYYTAPTIEGLKPASLMHVPKNMFKDVNILEALTTTFQPLKFLPLKECNHKLLLLIYDEDLLSKVLTQPGIRAFLKNFGYQDNASLFNDLDYLLSRFQSEGCPVEIGTFLGYPLEDVKAFAFEPMRPCLCHGYWKVYNQKEKAQATFQAYDNAKYRVCSQIIKQYSQGGLVA